MTQRVAIATTLRDADAVLDSYIKYHHSIGIDHFFLFFDEPNDPALKRYSNLPYITATPNNDILHQRWKWTTLYQTDYIRKSLDEHLARQLLNTELAISWAIEKEMQWLLHIDVDELFYSPDHTVQQHFQSLKDQGTRLVRYVNYEGVPEAAAIDDYFKKVTLFKKNPWTRAGRKLSLEEQQVFKDIPQVPDDWFFNFYGNGKTAAYLCEGLLPNGPHDFLLPEDRRKGSSDAHPNDDFVILHYPCCGFEAFWTKYSTLGKFPDKFLGTIDIASTIGTFHLEARDVVSTGDREQAMRFYESRLMIKNKADIQKLIESELACRIVAPSQALANL